MESLHPGGKRRPAVIVPIQFLRGVAASFVVAVHLLERLTRRGAFQHDLPGWVWSLGDIGVATFFVISGFIMVHTTAGEFGIPGSGKKFFYRRLIRVAPIYYITSAAMVVFMYLTYNFSTNDAYHSPTFPEIMMSLCFIPYLGPDNISHPVYVLGWTLEYEMFFYLVFAAALVLPRRIGLACVIMFLLAVVAAGTLIAPPEAMIGVPVPIYYFSRPLLLYFIIGMIMAVGRLKFGTIKTRIPDGAICMFALIALGIGVRLGPKGIDFASAVTIALAIAGVTLLESQQNRTTRLSVLSRAFGDASYSMYLTHSFFLGAIAVMVAHLAGTGPVVLFALIIATCVFCAAMAWVVWRFVEVPVTRLLATRPTYRPEVTTMLVERID